MEIWQNRDQIFVLWRNDGDFASWNAFAHETMDFGSDIRILALVGFKATELDAGLLWRIFGSNMLVDIDARRFTEAVCALLDNIMSELEDWLAGAIVLG